MWVNAGSTSGRLGVDVCRSGSVRAPSRAPLVVHLGLLGARCEVHLGSMGHLLGDYSGVDLGSMWGPSRRRTPQDPNTLWRRSSVGTEPRPGTPLPSRLAGLPRAQTPRPHDGVHLEPRPCGPRGPREPHECPKMEARGASPCDTWGGWSSLGFGRSVVLSAFRAETNLAVALLGRRGPRQKDVSGVPYMLSDTPHRKSEN